MTNTEPPNDPGDLTPEAVDPLDERLSAELDGAAAGDAAATGAAQRDGDDAAIDDRRRALASARDLLAIPPPPLDDITRRRLLRTAVADSPQVPRHDRHRLNRIVAVAAAVLVVIGVGGVALKTLDNGSSSGKSASRALANIGPEAGAVSSPATSLDLHEVSNPEVLRRRVEAALKAATLGSTTAPAPRQTNSGADRVAGATTGAQTNCLSAVRVPAGATPAVLAHATFDGAPAIVVVAHDGPRTLIFVLATSDCRLLSSQFLNR